VAPLEVAAVEPQAHVVAAATGILLGQTAAEEPLGPRREAPPAGPCSCSWTSSWVMDSRGVAGVAPQAVGERHAVQALVQVAEGEVLQAVWERHVAQALVELVAETLAWERHVDQALVEAGAEREDLQAARERHVVQALVEAEAVGE